MYRCNKFNNIQIKMTKYPYQNIYIHYIATYRFKLYSLSTVDLSKYWITKISIICNYIIICYTYFGI